MLIPALIWMSRYDPPPSHRKKQGSMIYEFSNYWEFSRHFQNVSETFKDLRKHVDQSLNDAWQTIYVPYNISDWMHAALLVEALWLEYPTPDGHGPRTMDDDNFPLQLLLQDRQAWLHCHHLCHCPQEVNERVQNSCELRSSVMIENWQKTYEYSDIPRSDLGPTQPTRIRPENWKR